MGLLEEFQAAVEPKQGPLCSVAILLASLDEKTANELRQLLAMNTRHTDLAEFTELKWPELAVRAGAVSRHRRGRCSC